MVWWKSLFKVLGKGLGGISKRFLGLFTFLWSNKGIVTIIAILLTIFVPVITTFITNGWIDGVYELGRNIFLPDFQVQQVISEINSSIGLSLWEQIALRGQLLAPLTTLGVMLYGLSKLFNSINNTSPLLTIGITLSLLSIGEILFIIATQDFSGLIWYERILLATPFRGIVLFFINLPIIIDPLIPFFDLATPNIDAAENFTQIIITNTTNSTG